MLTGGGVLSFDRFRTGNVIDNAGIWNEWLLGSGAYGKVRYRF